MTGEAIRSKMTRPTVVEGLTVKASGTPAPWTWTDVGAVAAVHRVVVLAAAPDEQVVARLALEDVAGADRVVVADDLVVAGAAVHLVDALAAEDLVVAGTGVDRRLGRARCRRRR